MSLENARQSIRVGAGVTDPFHRSKIREGPNLSPFKCTKGSALSTSTTVGIENRFPTVWGPGCATTVLLAWFQPTSSFLKPKAVLERAGSRISLPCCSWPCRARRWEDVALFGFHSCSVSFKGLSSQKMPFPPSLP